MTSENGVYPTDAAVSGLDTIAALTKHRIGEVFGAHYDRLCAYAQRLQSPGAIDEEDIVQQAFTNLITKSVEFDIAQDHNDILKYLFKTIQGLITNHRRDAEVDLRHRTLNADALQTVAGPTPAPPPDRSITEESLSLDIDRAISRLPKRCREIWLLRREGLSTAEVAATLGIGTGTVKAQMINAFKLLRQMLASWLDSDMEEISAMLEGYIGGRDA